MSTPGSSLAATLSVAIATHCSGGTDNLCGPTPPVTEPHHQDTTLGRYGGGELRGLGEQLCQDERICFLCSL